MSKSEKKNMHHKSNQYDTDVLVCIGTRRLNNDKHNRLSLLNKFKQLWIIHSDYSKHCDWNVFFVFCHFLTFYILISLLRDIPATLHILTGPPTTSSSCPTRETTKSFTVSVWPQLYCLIRCGNRAQCTLSAYSHSSWSLSYTLWLSFFQKHSYLIIFHFLICWVKTK